MEKTNLENSLEQKENNLFLIKQLVNELNFEEIRMIKELIIRLNDNRILLDIYRKKYLRRTKKWDNEAK